MSKPYILCITYEHYPSETLQYLLLKYTSFADVKQPMNVSYAFAKIWLFHSEILAA